MRGNIFLSRKTRDRCYRIAYWIAYRLQLGFWFLRRPRVRGAYVAVWHQERLLVIRNSYKPGYTLPCGRVKRGESVAAAAARELGEEVGIHVSPDRLTLSRNFRCRHTFTDETGSVYHLRLTVPPAVSIDRREVIWARFVDPATLSMGDLAPVVGAYLKSLR
jgi:8-oxo-dGTP diphosphatase